MLESKSHKSPDGDHNVIHNIEAADAFSIRKKYTETDNMTNTPAESNQCSSLQNLNLSATTIHRVLSNYENFKSESLPFLRKIPNVQTLGGDEDISALATSLDSLGTSIQALSLMSNSIENLERIQGIFRDNCANSCLDNAFEDLAIVKACQGIQTKSEEFKSEFTI